MDDKVKKLMDLGAESVAGSLIRNQREVAFVRNGVVTITDEGLRLLAAEDVEVKEVNPKRATRKTAAKKAAKKVEAPEVVEPAPVEEPAEAGEPSLDELLGG